jgi:hypothetical protein
MQPVPSKAAADDDPPRTATTDEALRWLIRTARARTGLSQKQAAQKIPGVGTSWLRHIESAWHTTVSTEALLNICEALVILPQHLRDLTDQTGKHPWGWLADELAKRQRLSSLALGGEELEQYLLAAPASAELKTALIAFARSYVSMQGKEASRLDPFADAFLATRKRDNAN